ncbi:ABC-F family ATP-binding cassette domain-containing protein [Azohydromonas caseinilytica]|uniref:Probable ATP-binding protein YheS n=1 Tax=Azohydromonas caseinilytica TaxID=2728836 RepID=A0A848F7F6_9BURK|nr:ATP-binding cassette domain-containing protein [Azohydromonas caseinilytica]NML14489.1 ATP-binding cassette domain-containing protein [Azohydromonas caseinilytica]
MITLRNVTLRRGAKVVLEGANVVLNPGEKAGLVGRNGAGKSSLFSLMAGRLHADAGDFEMPPTWRLGEVAQAMPETEQPATDFVLDGDLPLVEAREALAAAEASNDGHAIGEAHVKLEEAGAFDARSRAQALLLGLGFNLQQLDAPVNSFSGGWRMRLQLARALMCPADLLLLDEPTNHLDLDALVWLEGWLQRFKGTLLVISHDREFLDAITGVTLHLEDAQLTRYGGNYTAFESMRAERLSQQASAYERQQDKIAQLQRFIDRFKAKATKAKQAQSRVKALDRMEKLAPVLTASDFSFQFREPVSLPNPMLSLRELHCGYPGEHGPITIVRNVNRTVLAGQRIGILGANGQGKSTLVKTIARELAPVAGTLTEGKGLSIGYFAQQEMDLLHAEDTPLSHMIRLAKVVSPQAREQELRDFLGQFRFGGEMAAQAVGTLSGGEKARLVLASLVWQRPNLLLLDEPTNHLDLTTREALSMALNEFEGTVMLVSHDRALLREVCDEFWLVSRGGVEPFDGDLDDYQRWLLEQAKEAAKALKDAAAAKVAAETAAAGESPVNRKEERKAAAAQRQKLNEQAKPIKSELKKVETRLAKASEERDAALASLGAADLSPQQRADVGRRLKALEEEIEELEMKWLELGEQLEQLAG